MTKKKKLPQKKDTPKAPTITQDGNKINVDLTREICKTITGCQTVEASHVMAEMVGNAAADETGGDLAERQTKQYLSLMQDLAPRDPFEGMLISQMFLVFRQALHMISMSNLPGNRSSSALQESLTNRAVKLMRLFNQQLEALDRHRRGGKQKMTIEHLHVHEGGQAVVGNINRGGGVKNEK